MALKAQESFAEPRIKDAEDYQESINVQPSVLGVAPGKEDLGSRYYLKSSPAGQAIVEEEHKAATQLFSFRCLALSCFGSGEEDTSEMEEEGVAEQCMGVAADLLELAGGCIKSCTSPGDADDGGDGVDEEKEEGDDDKVRPGLRKIQEDVEWYRHVVDNEQALGKAWQTLAGYDPTNKSLGAQNWEEGKPVPPYDFFAPNKYAPPSSWETWYRGYLPDNVKTSTGSAPHGFVKLSGKLIDKLEAEEKITASRARGMRAAIVEAKRYCKEATRIRNAEFDAYRAMKLKANRGRTVERV